MSEGEIRSECIRVDGVDLHYQEAGSGPPVALVHGFPTNHTLWRGLIPRLARDHLVVAPDLLGFGLSERPADPALLGIGHQAGLLARLLRDVDPRPWAVVGHDIGGGIALHLAIGYADQVSRLALLDSVAYDEWPIPEIRAFRRAKPIAGHLHADLLRGLVKNLMARGFARRAGREADAILDLYLEGLDTPEGAHAFLAALTALDSRETHALTPRLDRVAVPTLLVWGDEDPFLKPAIGHWLQQDIPGAVLEVIPNAGHYVLDDAPEEVGDLLASFLREPTRARRAGEQHV